MSNFENLNDLNVLMNVLSGNLLPLSSRDERISVAQGFYAILAWLVTISELVMTITSMPYVPVEKTLQNSTVNIVVTAEVTLLVGHLYANKNLLRGLIGKLDGLLAMKNEALSSTVITALKPIEKPLRIYALVLTASVIVWISLPLIKIWQKSEFYYQDYGVPIKFSSEPFPMTIFIAGVLFETVSSTFIILKKIAIDVYMIYLIRLLTSQYRYVRLKLALVLRHMDKTTNRTFSGKSEILMRDELKELVQHHAAVLEISAMLKQLLAFCVGLLYVDNVFRFCFMGFMIITLPPDYFEKTLLVMYTIGAIGQLFILCFCAEQLLEASVSVTDDAFYEAWYACDPSVPRVLKFMTLSSKLESKLSAFGNMNLTVASFASILNQAYSSCLLFLRMK